MSEAANFAENKILFGKILEFLKDNTGLTSNFRLIGEGDVPILF